MAFTYNETPNDSERDYVRINIGDTAYGAGPRPDDANYSDEEITHIIAAEGNKQRAVAAFLEMLAREWVRSVSFKADGLQVNRSDIARGYRDEAVRWRARFGYAEQYQPIHSAGQINVDTYSDDVPNDQVTPAGEYAGSEFEYVRPK
jgi:hypothetical protein